MANRSKTPVTVEEEPFEALLTQLEALVHELETGDLPLETSLSLYERGVGLVRRAQGKLDHLDRRLETLLSDGTTEAMDPPAGLDVPPAPPDRRKRAVHPED